MIIKASVFIFQNLTGWSLGPCFFHFHPVFGFFFLYFFYIGAPTFGVGAPLRTFWICHCCSITKFSQGDFKLLKRISRNYHHETSVTYVKTIHASIRCEIEFSIGWVQSYSESCILLRLQSHSTICESTISQQLL